MLRYYYFEMSWVYIRMFLKAVKGGLLNSWTPNTSTELSVNLVDSLSLNFLTAWRKCVYTCTKNYCVNTSFSIVCRFLDKIKSLVFSLLCYLYSFYFNLDIRLNRFDWKEIQNKRKKWIKKREKNTPLNETDVLYTNRNIGE